MTATRAIIGYGTTVQLGDSSSPGVWTFIQEVIEVKPPNIQVADVEATHFISDNRTREYIPGLLEGGDASVGMNRIPGSATEIMLMGLQTSGTKVQVLITWPNGTTWQFLGHVKGYETASPIDDRMTATATFKVDGAQTITIASPPPG
jgi:Lambda phage tail tube protein, TTP